MSKVGIELSETSRDLAFCSHALSGEDLVVPDARRDERFADNPLVTGNPGVRFYAGVPLVAAAGATLGTLCVIDRVPRSLSRGQMSALQVLGRQVMNQIQSRFDLGKLKKSEAALLGMLDEQEVSAREQRQRVENLTVAQAVGKVGSWQTGTTTLEIQWSTQTHRIFETSPESFVPTRVGMMAFVHSEDRDALNESLLESFRHRAPCWHQHRIVMPDGRVKFIEQRWQAFGEDGDRPLRAVGIFQDISERKRAEDDRDRLFDLSLDLLCVANFEGRFLQVNPAWTQCLGWTSEELIGGVMADFIHPEDHEVSVRMRESITRGNSVRGFENRYRCKDGSYRWLSWNVHPVTGVQRVFAVARDVTEGKNAEQKLSRLNRLYQVLSRTHEMVVRVGARQELFEGVCRIAVEQGLFRAAGVFCIGADGETIHLTAHAGEDQSFFEAAIVQAFHGEASRGTLGTAIRTGVHDLCNDLANDPRMAPWKDAALARGYRSVAAFPLRNEGRTIGALGLFAAEPDCFQTDEIELLDSVAENLSFASDFLDKEQRRLKAETDLRASEATMATAQRIGHFGSWELELANPDPDANALSWSAGMFRIAGLEPGAVAVTNALFFQLVHPDDREAIHLAVAAAIREHGQYSIVHRIIRPDGEERLIHETAEIFFDEESGRPLQMIGNAHDVTEQRRVEDTLRESERRFRELAENINEVFWITDPHTREMLYVSPSYETIWGFTCESLYRSPHGWLDSIHPDDRERADRATSHEIPWDHDAIYRIVRADGEIRWIHDRAYPVRNDSGEVYRIVGTAQDITERKIMEQQFLRAQRMDSIGALAGGIAHDLNNVLAPILMSVELLGMRLTDPRALEILEMIGSSARRGAEMVTQVLSFARGTEAGRSLVQIAPVVRELAQVVAESFPKNIRIATALAPDLWAVEANATQLHQVLLNLCVNARDAMPDGGTITLSATNTIVAAPEVASIPGAHPGRHVQIDIDDTGTGMPAELLSHIFDPFFTTKEVGKGTGLGLCSVQSIVTGHGGFIEVSSEAGKGSRFRIQLPAKPEIVADCACESHPELPPGHGETVLVVDDEAAICEMTRQTLEAFGYTVLVASDGAEALSLFAKNRDRVAVVLTDMMMPLMDGPSLIRAMKELEPGLRVIGASGVADSSLISEAKLAGMLEFLAKPYTTPNLLKALKAVLTTRTADVAPGVS